MDVDRVRERLLFLNKEIHDERFSSMDLSEVMAMWETARDSFNLNQFGQAQKTIDAALAKLYLLQSQQANAQSSQNQKPQTPQPLIRHEKKPQMVSVYYDDEADAGIKIAEKLYSLASYFLKTCWHILARPFLAFEAVKRRCPARDVMAILAVFGFSATLNVVLYFKLGLLQNIKPILFSPLFGIALAAAASLAMRIAGEAVGVKTKTIQLACIFGFSLVPYTLFAIFSLALLLSSGQWLMSWASQAVLYGLIPFVLLIWSFKLQVLGLSHVYGIPREKSVKIAIASTLAAAALSLSAGALLVLRSGQLAGIKL